MPSITGNIADITNEVFPDGRLLVTLEASDEIAPGDVAGGIRFLPVKKLGVDADGDLVDATDIPATTGGYPLYRLTFEGRSGNGDSRKVHLGHFELTTDRTLDWIRENTFQPASISPQTVIDIAAAAALGATNDTATASFVNNPASATAAALTATFGEPIYLPAASGTNDTAAIQSAVDAASAQGGGIVRAREGQVYKVQQAGTITLRNPSGTTGSAGYCVKIPSNVHVDWAGSTVRLNSGDTRMFVNANPGQVMGTTSDHDLGMSNLTIDGNDVQLSAASIMVFNGCKRLTLRNVRLTNGKGPGVAIYNDDDGTYDGLAADDWAGNPFNFGNPVTGADMRGATIGTIAANGLVADAVAAFNLPGNPLYAVLTRCTVAAIHGTNCAGGIKLEAGSDNVIALVVLKGGGNGTSNSGLKLQGFDATMKTRRLTVVSVVAEGCYGQGLYIDDNTEDCTVQSYIGEGNAPTGGVPDVWLSGARNTIQNIRSSNTGLQGVQVRANAVDWRVGKVRVYNPGITAVTTTASAVSVASTSGGRIDELTAIDDRGGSANMRRGLSVDATNAAVDVGAMEIRGANNALCIYSDSARCTFGPLRLSASDAMAGTTLLTAGTSTTVTTGNALNSPGGGFYYRPVIELTPHGSAARALAAAAYTVPAAGSFSIKHGTAAGTETFRWRIVGLMREAFNIT